MLRRWTNGTARTVLTRLSPSIWTLQRGAGLCHESWLASSRKGGKSQNETQERLIPNLSMKRFLHIVLVTSPMPNLARRRLAFCGPPSNMAAVSCAIPSHDTEGTRPRRDLVASQAGRRGFKNRVGVRAAWTLSLIGNLDVTPERAKGRPVQETQRPRSVGPG